MPDISLCLQCQALTHGTSGIIRRAREKCHHRRWLAGVFQDPKGHTLAVGVCPSGGPVVLCLTCGAWARRIPRNLRRPCAPIKPSGARALDMIFSRGRHPTQDVRITSVWRVPRGSLLWEPVLQFR